MDTGVCMYCNRTLALPELLDKGGKYRCKDEEACLEEQIRINAPDTLGDPEDLSGWAKSLLSEAEERIAGYGAATETALGAEEAQGAFTAMAGAIDALAAECREKPEFQFRPDEAGGYAIAFSGTDGSGAFQIRIAPSGRAGYALTVALTEGAAPAELYRQFIYKSYPESRREDLLQDLAVVLLALPRQEDRRSALLGRLRREIEARGYRKGDA